MDRSKKIRVTAGLPALRRLIAWLPLLLSFGAKSQDSATITHNFTSQPFGQFVQYIEATTPYRFYYRAADVDSVLITAAAERQTIGNLLTQAFGNTALNFVLGEGGKVFCF